MRCWSCWADTALNNIKFKKAIPSTHHTWCTISWWSSYVEWVKRLYDCVMLWFYSPTGLRMLYGRPLALTAISPLYLWFKIPPGFNWTIGMSLFRASESLPMRAFLSTPAEDTITMAGLSSLYPEMPSWNCTNHKSMSRKKLPMWVLSMHHNLQQLTFGL